MAARISTFLFVVFYSAFASANETQIQKNLLDALVCKGKPESVVYDLVEKKTNFKNGYAAYGFGEGTAYKAMVILQEPINIGDAKAEAIVSETENSYFDFSAFTYAKFSGDYQKIVNLFSLVPSNSAGSAFGKYVSNISGCPKTIALTPLSNGQFLLGCGWHNGC
ncbi:hypothetical protein KJI95_00010 [Shewanella sp. JM162201]|uniref:Uncharacterized protein n=1 Tax=Shewanella jiangmenensis TaxID=2837387 RepID=A0ABS5UXV5_9GAMM|nr:hypothetical protein [Shewanella jiangmenensis]MBT1442911.1 hypothetical protein [Shewanella jiangmenensis]